MRLSVVDIGSNTVRLVIADADVGAPLPVHTAKWRLRLAQQVQPDGRFGADAVRRLAEAVTEAAETSRAWGAGTPLLFATAVVRDAPNCSEVLQELRERTGLQVHTLPGQAEAELTFLAARRWTGWHAGPMVMLDIGGGSFEVAFGRGRLPDFAVSLPLGAGRLTREHLGDADPPSPHALKELRRYVRHQLRDVAARIRWEAPRSAVVTSRTFQQLARLCGAPPGREGPFATRRLERQDLRRALRQLAGRSAAERAQLPGISKARSRQALAGALVGHTALKLMGLPGATVCPWAIREGVLLQQLEGDSGWWPGADDALTTAPASPTVQPLHPPHLTALPGRVPEETG
ncbi:Ppx/GppA family phosphatase [Streptomyces sp. A7024]|uniref:Ppx/GppA family phosphatase n=1 Tax=Streptomyces coryli TaxID=1128680 RepID=A0A6G4TTC8_9ACTN|nr:Ppx/GppA family phosphatase [Streptomyces coryli]NGN62716.1 Ppx/GppA family phosphatase [Streptomyces coryli]